MIQLLVQHENSKSLKVNLPILIQNGRFGEKNLVLDCGNISNYLSLDSGAIKRLASRFSYLKPTAGIRHRPKRDGLVLAREYNALIHSGDFSSRAELARFLGVSRARVIQVLNRLNRGGKT